MRFIVRRAAIVLLLSLAPLAATPPAAAPAASFRPVVESPATDGAPTWAPDGETIAFSSLMTENDWEIYLVGAWGGEVTFFTHEPGTDIYADWSPDGQWIAFTNRRDNGDGGTEDMDLWLQSLDGDSLRCLTFWPGYDNFAAHDPAGERIAFVSDRDGEVEVWVLDLAGGEPVKVSQGLEECYHPCWSPDGQWIAFDTRDQSDPTRSRLYRVPAAGGQPEEIETGLLVANDPHWSPDGRWLAFAGGDHPVDWDLWLRDMETGNLVQLTNTPRFAEQSPVWNAAGTEIAYAALPHGNKDVWVAYDLPTGTAARATSWGRLKNHFR